VSSYTISITPDNAANASTVVRVDLGADVRITELTVRAGTGDGLSAHQVPAVDLDMLLRALTVTGGPSAIEAAVASESPAPETVVEAISEEATGSVRPTKRAKATGGRAAKRATKSAGASKSTGRVTRTATARKAAHKGTSGTATGRRAYRKLPDDVADVFRQLNSVTAVAAHYGVPRHTAQGWIGRLRKEGALPAGR
jgi:hypothetical protein